MYRLILRLSPCLFLLVLAGCASHPHSSASEAVVPWNGGKLNPAVWTAPLEKLLPNDPSLTANQSDHEGLVPSIYFKQHDQGAQEDSIWGFPYVFHGKGFTVDRPNQSAKLDELRYLDLGSYLLFLPIRITHSTQHYRQQSGEAVGRQDVQWNLFWAGQQGTGDLGDTRVEAAGLPLIWSRISEVDTQSNERRWSVMNIFWTFGPLMVDAQDSQEKSRMRISVPVMLASVVGPLFWTNLVHEDKESSLRMHGPLVGSAGYMSYRKPNKAGEHSDDITLFRMILLGSVWMDLEHESRAMHGPLWGCFGWGKYAGRPAIQVLWIPIPMGK